MFECLKSFGNSPSWRWWDMSISLFANYTHLFQTMLELRMQTGWRHQPYIILAAIRPREQGRHWQRLLDFCLRDIPGAYKLSMLSLIFPSPLAISFLPPSNQDPDWVTLRHPTLLSLPGLQLISVFSSCLSHPTEGSALAFLQLVLIVGACKACSAVWLSKLSVRIVKDPTGRSSEFSCTLYAARSRRGTRSKAHETSDVCGGTQHSLARVSACNTFINARFSQHRHRTQNGACQALHRDHGECDCFMGSHQVDEMFWNEAVLMGAWHCDCTKCHPIVHLKMGTGALGLDLGPIQILFFCFFTHIHMLRF